MKRTSNGNCRTLVINKAPFQANNIFARAYVRVRDDLGEAITDAHNVEDNDPRIIDHWYVVYSYGDHWPMFICAGGKWYENSDRYSMTTSKHRGQAHPHRDTTLMCRDEMVKLASQGLMGYVRSKVSQPFEYREAA